MKEKILTNTTTGGGTLVKHRVVQNNMHADDCGPSLCLQFWINDR